MVDGGGNLVIPTTRDAGRVVGGAILALVGGGIGVQIVRAISANRASTHAAWTAYIPAILVFGGIALAFLVPGVAMLIYQRYVRVDLANRQITENARYLGYWRTRAYPLSRFKTIVIAIRYRSSSRRGSSGGSSSRRKSYRFVVVELAAESGKPLRVVAEQYEAPAHEVAASLASATGLPLWDRTSEDDQDENEDQDEDQAEDDNTIRLRAQ
jgi:hypothetical protein